MLGVIDMRTPVQERHQLSIVPSLAVRNPGIDIEHRFQPWFGLVRPGRDFTQSREVCGDVALVPGREDRFAARKIL